MQCQPGRKAREESYIGILSFDGVFPCGRLLQFSALFIVVCCRFEWMWLDYRVKASGANVVIVVVFDRMRLRRFRYLSNCRAFGSGRQRTCCRRGIGRME